MDFNSACLGTCTPAQIINFNVPVKDISTINIYNDCECEYSTDNLQYSYSLDSLCWSCYMSYKEAMTNLVEIDQDYFLRIKISGIVNKIYVNGELYTDYSTQLATDFTFAECGTNNNTFNPYTNLDCAINLYQQLSETVSCIVGIPCYYIKLSPDQGSKDIVFKEYALLNVDSIKLVKIVIQDNEMPSSKPEFNDWGLDWQTDWEVEITKGTFATAFGNTAQPMEGDLVYIPMMKRMWMVNEAYEEKKDGFMWIASTFKLALVKYQEKGSVDLGTAEEFVESIVKNKYEDLFGEDNFGNNASNEESLTAPLYPQNKLYNVFESDAIRKYITCDTVDIIENKLYYRGTLIADNLYSFSTQTMQSRIGYQKQFCGADISISFIAHFLYSDDFSGSILKVGTTTFNIEYNHTSVKLTCNKMPGISIDIPIGIYLFIIIKWSKSMNIFEMHAYRYTHREEIPLYKLNPAHYYFDIDNPESEITTKYNIELEALDPASIEINNFVGTITNLKVFDVYNDNTSELLQMYPNNKHLIFNDTCRKLVDLPGVKPY